MEVRKVIIPAAGRGTRLKNIKRGLPKEVLAINEKPMINYSLKELEETNIKDAYIVISKSKGIIKRYLLKINKKVNLNFIYQPHPLGLADAILRVKNFIKNEPFLIILPDNIYLNKTNVSCKIISNFRKFRKNMITCIKVPRQRTYQFSGAGGIAYTSYGKSKNIIKITKFHSKKKSAFSTNNMPFRIRTFARYIFFPEIFTYIEKIKKEMKLGKEEFDDVPVMQEMLKHKDILGCIVEAEGAFDCGNVHGFKAANLFARK